MTPDIRDTEGNLLALSTPAELREALTMSRVYVASLEGAAAESLVYHRPGAGVAQPGFIRQLPDDADVDRIVRARLRVELLEQALSSSTALHQFLASSEREGRRAGLSIVTSQSTSAEGTEE
jgi:hypothetical protein